MGLPTPVLILDGCRYHRSTFSTQFFPDPFKLLWKLGTNKIVMIVETDDIPAGWVSVPVELDDNGDITNAAMVAGE